jgi:hypothetical protein
MRRFNMHLPARRRMARINCGWFALALIVTPGLFAADPAPRSTFPAQGIAARYPGDVGIEHDPKVIFTENFEEDSLDALWKRWETFGDRPGMAFSDDAPPGSAGKHSLVMQRNKGSGAQLYRRLKNKEGGWGYDRVFARYYVKFDPKCGEIHHFGTCLGGTIPRRRGLPSKPASRRTARNHSGQASSRSAKAGRGTSTPTGATCAAVRPVVRPGATRSSAIRI